MAQNRSQNLAVFCGSVRDEEVCPDAKKTEVIMRRACASSTRLLPISTLSPSSHSICMNFGSQFHQYHPSSLRWALIHDYLEKDGHFNNYNRCGWQT